MTSAGLEVDPQVGTLTAGRLCTTDGTDIDCATVIPTCNANEVLKSNGTALSCVVDAGAAAGGGALWTDNTTYITHTGNAAVTAGTHGAGDVLGLAGAGARSFFSDVPDHKVLSIVDRARIGFPYPIYDQR